MAIEAPAKRPELATVESLVLLRRVRVEYVVLAGILLVGLAVRAYFSFGLVKVDPFTYADAAGSIARWEPVFDSSLTGDVYYTQYIRLSLNAPAAALYKLFGASDAASVAWPVAVSLAMAVLAFWSASLIAGRVGGLIAAAAVCLFPLNVINSTQFLPDIILAGFASLATACFVASTEFERTRTQRFWLFFGVGAGLALAFYARPTAVALVPPMAMLFVARRCSLPELAGGILGGAVVLAGAQGLMMALGAGFLEDIAVLRRINGGTTHFSGVDFGYARVFLTDRMFWPFFVPSGIGLAALLWKRGPLGLYRSPAFPLLVIIAGQYIYYEFFMSLPGTPTWWKEPRYALPIVFPILVVGGAGWAELGKSLLAERPGLATAVSAAAAGLLAVAAIPPVANEYDFYINHDQNRVDFEQRAIAAVIPDGATVYVHDDDFARPLSYRMDLGGTFYERVVSQSGRLHARFDRAGTSRVTPGSYVVTLQREQWWALPTAPSPDWELVWEGPSGVKVHRVPEARAAGRPGSEPASRAGVDSPFVMQAEDWGGVAGSWRTIREGYLSFGSGLLGDVGGSAGVEIEQLTAGDYWVEFLVWDYGKGVNELTVELNGVEGRAAWGNRTPRQAGPARARAFLRDVPAGRELRVEVTGMGQDAVIVDAVAISGSRPPD